MIDADVPAFVMATLYVLCGEHGCHILHVSGEEGIADYAAEHLLRLYESDGYSVEMTLHRSDDSPDAAEEANIDDLAF